MVSIVCRPAEPAPPAGAQRKPSLCLEAASRSRSPRPREKERGADDDTRRAATPAKRLERDEVAWAIASASAACAWRLETWSPGGSCLKPYLCVLLEMHLSKSALC